MEIQPLKTGLGVAALQAGMVPPILILLVSMLFLIRSPNQRLEPGEGFCLLAYWLRSSVQTTACPVGR